MAYISDSPKPPSERITLTLSELNASARAMFVCTGIGKAQVVKSILEVCKFNNPPLLLKRERERVGKCSNGTVLKMKEDNCQLPGALVRDPMVEWFLDEAAASHLSDGTAQS